MTHSREEPAARLSAFWHRLMLIGFLCSLASCATMPAPDPAHLSLSTHVKKRVYWIVHAKNIDEVRFHDGQLDFIGNTGDYLAHGSATPITADGYFLTNAHVVKKRDKEAKLWLIDFNRGKPRFASLEIVWQDEKGDSALVKSKLASPQFYQWYPSGKLPKDTILIQTGYRAHMAHGKTLSDVALDEPGKKSAIILCTVKSQRGDSGAAFIDEEGRFVAMNSQWRIRGSRAVRPNQQLILQLIRDHRAGR